MLEMTWDFIVRSFDLDLAGWFVLIAIGMAGYTLFSQMIGDHSSALLGTPMLVIGAALGHRASFELGLINVGDKLMNLVAGMSAGMLLGAAVAITIMWSWNAATAK